jgi:hypothetical protein
MLACTRQNQCGSDLKSAMVLGLAIAEAPLLRAGGRSNGLCARLLTVRLSLNWIGSALILNL